MVFKEMVIKNIKEVTEPLKEQILKGDVHTIDEMKAWLKPLGYSDTINEAAINFILREFVMSKVPSGSLCNAEMIVELFRPQLEHQSSDIILQPSAIFRIVPSSRPDWIERSIYESEYMNIERFHNELAMRLGYANSMDL